MVEPLDRRYVAGFLDGEGCIQLCGKYRVKVRLTIANTNKEIIQRLFDEFGGSIREYDDTRQYKSGRFRKPVYYWSLYCTKAEKLLRECYPYLIVKRGQAQAVFLAKESLHQSYRTVPAEEAVRREKLHVSISELNRKGRSSL